MKGFPKVLKTKEDYYNCLVPCVDMSHYVYVPRLDTLPYVGVAVLSHTVCAVNDARNAGNALYVFTYIAMVYAVYSQL